MKYSEHVLTEPLQEYIQSIWSLESEEEGDTYPRSTIMPDGIVELVFHFRDPFFTWQQDKQFLQPASFAVSMMRQYIEIASSGKTGFIAVRFFPWGAYHFFDAPVRNFLDQTIDAGRLWDTRPQEIVDELRGATTIEERFNITEDFLLEKLQLHKKDTAKADAAIQHIRTNKGQLPIEQVCEETGITKKQLERMFLSTVGTMPKIFSRICRFLHICNNLEQYRDKNLTQLAYECGFYDQSHFIKEFKSFSGFTPKEYFAKEGIYFSEI